MRFEGGREVDRFSELVAVEGRIPPEIVRLTGITDSDLDGAPPVEELLPRFLEFLGADPLVGHNVSFDHGFLFAEIDRLPAAERPAWTPGPLHDTRLVARAFFPTLDSFSLASLTRIFEVELAGHHRAVNDAVATGKLLLELLARARRTPFGELNEMHRIIGGAALPIGSIIEGLSAIGPGEAGPDTALPLPDNRLGRWDGGADDEVADRELDPEEIEGFFAEEGPLARALPGYRRREGQVEMARDVFRTLTDGGTLLAEAGTGTGKSFAYLLPALLTARSGGGRVMVSTHTRHLQDQLFGKDLPTLNEALGGGVRAVLLKGRNNYICRRRYEAMVADPSKLDAADREALLPLVRWMARTRTGDISEAPAFKPVFSGGLWNRITSESGFCSARVCRASPGCFLHRIRSSAQAAHVVLLNHALLFSDLAAGGGVLGDYDRLVFDEAQHVEKVAAESLGFKYNLPTLRTTLTRLYDPASERGLLVRLQTHAPRLKTPLERGSADADPLENAILGVKKALETGTAFLRELDAALRSEADRNGYSRRIRYRSGEEEFADYTDLVETHREALKKLDDLLDELARELTGDEGTLPAEGDDIFNELQRLSIEAGRLAAAFGRLTGGGEENTVFWVEVPSSSRGAVTLYGAPLDVGSVLKQALYPRLHSLVLTSATLTVDNRFDYLKSRLGIEEEAAGGIYDSPFDLRGQLFIAVADFLGDPKRDEKEFTRRVARLAQRLPTELDAGTFILFTSQRMLRNVHDLSGPQLEREGWLTLAQGRSGGRADMLQRFREERRSVLYGVDSFWEGVDIPGESLELAIIARVPFAVPTEPLVEARSEKIRREGGDPFREYTLPEAALRLRQGIGRLIRTTEDVGVAVICDPRLIHSRWGKTILRSLPVGPLEYHDYDSLLADLRGFLRGHE